MHPDCVTQKHAGNSNLFPHIHAFERTYRFPNKYAHNCLQLSIVVCLSKEINILV